LYDAIPEFPEWETEDELTALVAFTDEHELFSSEAANGFHAWRVIGSTWMPPPDEHALSEGDVADAAHEGVAAAVAAAAAADPFDRNDSSNINAAGDDGTGDLVFPADAQPADMAAVVVEQLMTTTIVPMFRRFASKLDAATQCVLATFLGDARVILADQISAKLASMPSGTPFTAAHVHEMLGDLMGTLTAKWREITGQA
jgi:hypothetical protein